MPRSSPQSSIHFEGREWVASDNEPGRLVQSGPVVVISRREAADIVAKCERYADDIDGPKADYYLAKADAFRPLIETSDREA